MVLTRFATRICPKVSTQGMGDFKKIDTISLEEFLDEVRISHSHCVQQVLGTKTLYLPKHDESNTHNAETFAARKGTRMEKKQAEEASWKPITLLGAVQK